MEESAQDRAKSDSADALNWTPEERIFVQSAVRPNLVVVMHGLKPQSGSSVERQAQLYRESKGYHATFQKGFNDTLSNARHDNNCARDNGSWWHDRYLHGGL